MQCVKIFRGVVNVGVCRDRIDAYGYSLQIGRAQWLDGVLSDAET